MFLERGLVFTHEAVRDWEARFAPLIADELRKRRSGNRAKKMACGRDLPEGQGEVVLPVPSYRQEGRLIDVRLSETRDMESAKSFFEKAPATAGELPEKVTSDGHDAYPRAVEETLGEEVEHRTSRYLNNKLEQDHRGIEGRCKTMRCFKCFISASRFCDAFDALRDYLRPRNRPNESLPLPEQHGLYLMRS